MTVHSAIYSMLSKGQWWAPHEVNLELRLRGIPCAAEATTARMRDLRKDRYGSYIVNKQRRTGTDYYEYTLECCQYCGKPIQRGLTHHCGDAVSKKAA